MNAVLEFTLKVLIATSVQMLVLFGPLLIAGFLIAVFEKYSNKMLMKVFSFKAVIYSTGWIGTPIHESGHALFCLIFGHKITEFVPFKPERNESGGYTLGYVNHSDKGTLWNKIGYLFIGAGPVILGSTIIALLLAFLLPGDSNFFGALFSQAKVMDTSAIGYLDMLWETVKLTFRTISGQPWGSFGTPEYVRFGAFIILSASISLHMSLSPPDLKSAWKGAAFIALLLLAVNIILVALSEFGVTDIVLTKYISAYLMFIAGVLSIGVLLSLITFLFILLFTSLVAKIKG